MGIILVTGPARSGKSEWAEYLAKNQENKVIYVATAQINLDDAEWQSRIENHRLRRPKEWETVESPQALTKTLEECQNCPCVLVDSLGTWVANELEQSESNWEITIETLIDSLKTVNNTVILVAEETGWGVIPAYPLGRSFRDRLGSLIRQVGAIAQKVYLVTGGYAINLTEFGQRLPDESKFRNKD